MRSTAPAAAYGLPSIPIVARIMALILAPPTSTENIGQRIAQLTNMQKEFSDYLVEKTSLTPSSIDLLTSLLSQAKKEADARLLTSMQMKDCTVLPALVIRLPGLNES